MFFQSKLWYIGKLMDREKKLGILYLIIGVCIPLLVLPFVSGYDKDKNIFENIYRIGIPIKKDKGINTEDKLPVGMESEQSKYSQVMSRMTPKRIPFRFFLVVTLVLFYMGIVRIDSARRRKKKLTAVHESNKEIPDGKDARQE